MTSDAAARLARWADQGELPLQDLRTVLAEHRDQAARIAELEANLAAARKFIEPIWVATVARIVPLWRQLGPLLAQGETAEAPK